MRIDSYQEYKTENNIAMIANFSNNLVYFDSFMHDLDNFLPAIVTTERYRRCLEILAKIDVMEWENRQKTVHSWVEYFNKC